MQIIDVKNNLVKIAYDTASENLLLSSFVVISDTTQSFIGQVAHLETKDGQNTAILRLLFNFDDKGVITNYNGSIPSVNAPVSPVSTQELLALLPANDPIFLGELSQQNIGLSLDKAFLQENLLVCCENQENIKTLTNSLSAQLFVGKNKVVVVDLVGNMDYHQNKVVAGVDFRLPLNYDSINFIYEKGLDDASGETKALIQEVFLEVQEYVKTLPEGFIPFENFKAVVDSQYEEMELTELLLLKNKLLKFYDEGVFAQEEQDFKTLENHISQQNLTVFDLSKMEDIVQREMISHLYSLISQMPSDVYVLLNLNNENSDKKLLKKVYTAKNAFTALTCAYDYKYLKELKQLAKTQILFAPLQPQSDFAAYNAFLSKLAHNEFVIYGASTKYMPLLVNLKEATQAMQPQIEEEILEEEPQIIEDLPEPQSEATEKQIEATNMLESLEEDVVQEDLLEEQIIQDVDEIYTVPKSEKEEVLMSEVLPEETLTDDDLDFIEENIIDDNMEAQMQPDVQQVPIDQNEDVSAENVFSDEPEQNFTQVLEQQAQDMNVSLENPPEVEILPQDMATTPIVPTYPAEVEPVAQSDELAQGDTVMHQKYGKGVVEKMINYGDKTLCSVSFENVGRRLLDPVLTELKKI